MDKPLFFGRVDRTGPTFSVQRTLAALKMVAKAAQCEPLELPFNDEGIITTAALGVFVVNLREQIDLAFKNQGSLTVRFLGDLKPSVYTLDTHFFRINPNGDAIDDFAEILKRSLLGQNESEEVTFVNLSNVRDVKLRVGSARVVGATSDLSYLSGMADTFDLWDKENVAVKIYEAE